MNRVWRRVEVRDGSRHPWTVGETPIPVQEPRCGVRVGGCRVPVAGITPH